MEMTAREGSDRGGGEVRGGGGQGRSGPREHNEVGGAKEGDIGALTSSSREEDKGE